MEEFNIMCVCVCEEVMYFSVLLYSNAEMALVFTSVDQPHDVVSYALRNQQPTKSVTTHSVNQQAHDHEQHQKQETARVLLWADETYDWLLKTCWILDVRATRQMAALLSGNTSKCQPDAS